MFLLLPVTAYQLYTFRDGLGTVAQALAGQCGARPLLPLPPERLQPPLTCLVYGIDAGEWVNGTYRAGPGRADTILLLRIEAGNEAALLSIPRDTLVEIPGRSGEDKINHAYAYGQAALLRRTVEQFTGLTVDYCVGLNYRAFVDIVDLLGGVEFAVDRVITAYGLRLEKGLQRLDGRAAFAVVNTRDDPWGDLDRIRRQQRFIRAVLEKARKSHPDVLFYTLLAAWRHLESDFSLAEVVGLAGGSIKIDEAKVNMAIVPGSFYRRDGISYWKPDRAETGALLERLFTAPGAASPGALSSYRSSSRPEQSGAGGGAA